jgi:CRISPR/Cas system CSM-associated protein Csm4 (group 5 of RAMP superfamily)
MKTYTVHHLFQLLLGLSLTLFLSLIFPIAQIKAENLSTLAVVKVPCPKLEVTRLLVGDNEPKDALFPYPVSSKQLDSTRQSQLTLEKKIKISDMEAIAKLADQSLADKDTCEQANAFNTEGAVAIPDSLSLEKKNLRFGLGYVPLW